MGVRDALALYPFVRRPGERIEAQFDGIPFYYAHMRGADIRGSVYLTACMTWRLFPDWRRKLSHAKRVMPRAGVGAAHLRCEHQLICRKGESANVNRVGLVTVRRIRKS